MYHKIFLTNLCRSASNKQLEGNFSDHERKLQGIAFGEAIAYIEDSLMTSTEQIPTFKLSDLIKLYVTCLSALAVHLETRVLSTRFKTRLVSRYI